MIFTKSVKIRGFAIEFVFLATFYLDANRLDMRMRMGMMLMGSMFMSVGRMVMRFMRFHDI